MTETSSLSTVVASPLASKKLKKMKSKSATKKSASHPPTANLVNNAIKNLKERGGSSLQAIKKYISSTYKIDSDKIAPFIKKYLKNGVEKGILIRTKGKGASGSFKLATAGKVEGTKKVAVKKTKVATVKKVSKAKKATPKKVKSAAKSKSAKPKAAKKSRSKAKKATKAPAAKKPKAPKPKKASPKKVAKKLAQK